MPQRVLWGNLVSFQGAREARCPAYTVELEHRPEYLAHDLRRQLDSYRTGHAVSREVAILRLAIHFDCVRFREHVVLSYVISKVWCAKVSGLTSWLA